METFVLKRTDAKKCYVVNNIFRFQDQVFCNGTDGKYEYEYLYSKCECILIVILCIS